LICCWRLCNVGPELTKGFKIELLAGVIIISLKEAIAGVTWLAGAVPRLITCYIVGFYRPVVQACCLEEVEWYCSKLTIALEAL